MLSDTHRAIVKATVPLLETGGEALTTHFYRLLFSEHPEVKALFNAAHQRSGAQPRALANGVLMYARHIDHLENLGGLVAQIVHKHVSLQVRPEHYPLVGGCLLRAIREVLGPEIATDEVIAAWAAAYQQLADLLIAAEEQVYAGAERAPGGWRGSRPFVVARKERESAEITSLYLEPADGRPVSDFSPGQYIGLRVVIDGQEHRRNYSLSSAANGKSYRISVKREGGGAVSRHLHDTVTVGSTLEIYPPAGEFVLRDGDRPLVLISGGVGITPMLAMLEAGLRTARPIHFIHCARSRDVHAFRDYIDAQAAQHPQLRRYFCYGQHADGAADAPDAVGLLTPERLAQWLPEGRDVDAYFVGPTPFMAQLRRDLLQLGVPAAQTHWEFFGPAAALA